MSLLANPTLPAVAILWVFVVIRLAGVPRGGSRLLALILFLLATMFTIKLTFVGDLIDEATGVIGLQVYARDIIAVNVAAISAHTVAGLARDRAAPRWTVAVTAGIVLAAATSMALFFVGTGPARNGIVDLGAPSGELPALGFWLSYLLPYGSFLGIVAAFAAHDARRAGAWTRGRRGLALFGIGASAGVLYVVTKILVLTHTENAFVMANATAIQGIPSVLAVGFIAAGAATWTDLHVRERLLLLRLRPAHRALTRMQPAPHVDQAALSIPERLDRRIIEIGEAIIRHQNDLPNAPLAYVPEGQPETSPRPLVRQLTAARRANAQGRRTRIARAITEVLAPPNLGVLLLVALGVRDGALGWALVGATFVSLLPYLVVIIGVRRGVWRDRMLTSRRERLVPIISNVSFAVVGFAVLLASPAPRELAAFLGAAIATQAVLFAITLFWKISFHTGVAAGVLTIVGLEFAWWAALSLLPLLAVIAWSRVQLSEHTARQVLAGAPLGAVLLGGGYAGILALMS